MSTLLSLVSSQDPFSDGLITGLDRPGPLLRLLGSGAFNELILFESADFKSETKATIKAILARFPHVRLSTHSLGELKLHDVNHLVSTLKASIDSALTSETRPTKRKHVYIHAPSSMPELRSALTLLTTMEVIDAELIELKDSPYFATPPQIVKHENQSFRSSGAGLFAAQPEAPFLDDIIEELNLIGDDPQFQKAINIASALAEHETPILIQGETGTGKDLFTRLIHRLSRRCHQPLVVINCATLPEPLAESILFGHTKGAFSGATHDQIGKFEHADGGTLFLDELGELSPNNQSKLLRVLEDGIVERLGSNTPRKVDVRIITATNRNLKEAVKDGRFREDLYYRLSVGEFYLPALRERRADIPKLALHFLSRINDSLKEPKQLTQESLKYLESLPLPGNIRDLRNTIERAAMLSRNKVLSPEELNIVTLGETGSSELPSLSEGFSLEYYLSDLRKRIINKAIIESNNNKSLAARRLGVSPQAVHKFVKTNVNDDLGSN